MKHTQYRPSRQPAYPNAADANYFARRASQLLAALASGFGVIAGMIFLVILA